MSSSENDLQSLAAKMHHSRSTDPDAIAKLLHADVSTIANPTFKPFVPLKYDYDPVPSNPVLRVLWMFRDYVSVSDVCPYKPNLAPTLGDAVTFAMPRYGEMAYMEPEPYTITLPSLGEDSQSDWA